MFVTAKVRKLDFRNDFACFMFCFIFIGDTLPAKGFPRVFKVFPKVFRGQKKCNSRVSVLSTPIL